MLISVMVGFGDLLRCVRMGTMRWKGTRGIGDGRETAIGLLPSLVGEGSALSGLPELAYVTEGVRPRALELDGTVPLDGSAVTKVRR